MRFWAFALMCMVLAYVIGYFGVIELMDGAG